MVFAGDARALHGKSWPNLMTAFFQLNDSPGWRALNIVDHIIVAHTHTIDSYSFLVNRIIVIVLNDCVHLLIAPDL